MRCTTGGTVAVLVVALGLALAPRDAAGHGRDSNRMTERQLRAFEKKVLGAEHAAEHARARAAARRERARLARCRRAGRKCRPRGVAPHRKVARSAPRLRPAARAAALSDDGRWGQPFQIPVMAIHAALLPTGKVLWFSYPERASSPNVPNHSVAYLWDPATGANKRVDPPLWRDPADGKLKPANIWCGGQSLLADGRVLVTGGNLAYATSTSDYKGLNKAYTFNPWNETWTEQPDMRKGRWYPSQSLLPDGRTVIMSGYDESGRGYAGMNNDVEIFTPSADLDGRGTMDLLGTRGGAGQPPSGGTYPYLVGMPDGRTLVAGPERRDSWILGRPGSGNTFSWTDIPDLRSSRWYAGGSMIPGTTRWLFTGGRETTNSAEVLDTSAPQTGWQAAGALRYGRADHNQKLLPDGSIISFGGGYGRASMGDAWSGGPDQRKIEILDPATQTWRAGPAQAETRAYHSIALLLPDGRVVSAGDDINGGTTSDTAEIYEPPYLFKGPRPTITSVPTSVRWGSTFSLTASGPKVTRAVLMAPGATTHAVDMSQSYIPLTLNERPDGGATVDVVAPPNADVARPGYYMLFALTADGVPSVAKWVKLGSEGGGTNPNPQPTPTSENKAAGRPTSASSTELGLAQFGPSMAVDQLLTTRWASDYRDGEWWQVDLGRARSVSRVTINWEAAWASRSSISVSQDGTSWTKVADVTTGRAGAQTMDFPMQIARYVRITGDVRATEWGTSFWDVGVYGPDDSSTTPPPSPEDKAAGRPTASSGNETPDFGPEKAVDGNDRTRWSSGYADRQWWQVDLGSRRLVDKVVIDWEDAYASSYSVSLSSDGATWTPVATLTADAARKETVTFGAELARYVRVTAIVRGTEWGSSFWTVNVFGPQDEPAPPPPPVSEDKALGRPATASSVEEPVFAPANAVDGSANTRWSSALRDGEWWQVDLGRSRSVTTVTVNWEDAYATTYRIQTSNDGQVWDTAATVSGRVGAVATTFAERSARYVRIVGDARATEWGVSFWDVRVTGSPD